MLRVRIGFEDRSTTAWVDFEFVQTAGGEFWNEELPDSGVVEALHLVVFAVPAVEVSDDTDTTRVWRPDSEGDALFSYVGAEFFIDLFVAAFAEEMEIDVAKYSHGLDGS